MSDTTLLSDDSDNAGARRRHQTYCANPDPSHSGGCPLHWFGPSPSVVPAVPDLWAEPVAVVTPPTIGFLDFHGITVPVLVDERGRWVSVSALSTGLGIAAHGQAELIKRKHWSGGCTRVTRVQVPGDVQSRDHFFLHEKRVPMWLASIDTARLQDSMVRARVEATQVEFADVLDEWVSTGEVKPKGPTSPEPRKELSNRELALMVIAEADLREQAERLVLEQAPAVAAHARHQVAEGAGVLLEQVAKDLREDFPGLTVSSLRRFLNGSVIYQRTLECGTDIWDVYAKHMRDDAPRFRFRSKEVQHNTRPEVCSHRTILVCPAGVEFIAARLRRAGWTA